MVQFVCNFILLLLSIYALAQQAPAMAKSHCQASCGDVDISYPFGIGANCSIDDWFEIVCNNETSYSQKPFLKRVNREVLGISVDEGTIQVNGPIFYMEGCIDTANFTGPRVDLEGSPFVFSQTRNKFIAVSCGVIALISDQNDIFLGGCMSICNKTSSVINTTCNGINCCQTAIPNDLVNFTVTPVHFVSTGQQLEEDRCRYAFLADQQWYDNSVTDFKKVRNMKEVPMVLDWVLYNHTLNELGMNDSTANTSSSSCLTTSNSISNATSSSYQRRKLQCSCKRGYEGNPYLPQGCRSNIYCPSDYKHS